MVRAHACVRGGYREPRRGVASFHRNPREILWCEGRTVRKERAREGTCPETFDDIAVARGARRETRNDEARPVVFGYLTRSVLRVVKTSTAERNGKPPVRPPAARESYQPCWQRSSPLGMSRSSFTSAITPADAHVSRTPLRAISLNPSYAIFRLLRLFFECKPRPSALCFRPFTLFSSPRLRRSPSLEF